MTLLAVALAAVPPMGSSVCTWRDAVWNEPAAVTVPGLGPVASVSGAVVGVVRVDADFGVAPWDGLALGVSVSGPDAAVAGYVDPSADRVFRLGGDEVVDVGAMCRLVPAARVEPVAFSGRGVVPRPREWSRETIEARRLLATVRCSQLTLGWRRVPGAEDAVEQAFGVPGELEWLPKDTPIGPHAAPRG